MLLSGYRDALRQLADKLPDRAAIQISPTATRAFHSPLQGYVSDFLEPWVESTPFQTPEVPFCGGKEFRYGSHYRLPQLREPCGWTPSATDAGDAMTTTEHGVGLADQSADAETVLAWFRRMRESQPVSHDEQAGVWHVFGYADAARILADPPAFSSDFSALSPSQKDVDLFRKGNLLRKDPPQHRKPTTVDEVLRYRTPLAPITRRTTGEVRIGDQKRALVVAQRRSGLGVFVQGHDGVARQRRGRDVTGEQQQAHESDDFLVVQPSRRAN